MSPTLHALSRSVINGMSRVELVDALYDFLPDHELSHAPDEELRKRLLQLHGEDSPD